MVGPRRNADARSPLDAAFVTSTSPARVAAPAAWVDPILTAADLDEAAERRLLRETDNALRLLPYRDFDPNRPPVVLVHGINGASQDLKDMAERLRAGGRQVFFAVYADRGRETVDNGRHLAEALVDLRQRYYPANTPLDIVAHSMGGIVSRAALNYLQDPTWLDSKAPLTAIPRAGFGHVRLRTLDTPWDGFPSEPKAMGFMAPVIRLFMRLFGWLGAYDMRASSPVLRHLYDPQLAQVDIESFAARQPGKQDGIRALPDLSVAERVGVARYLLTGALPETSRARNLALSLAQDTRFAELKQAFASRVAREQPSPERQAQILVEVYEQVMPRWVGSHTSILQDDPERDDDLVDTVTRELTS